MNKMIRILYYIKNEDILNLRKIYHQENDPNRKKYLKAWINLLYDGLIDDNNNIVEHFNLKKEEEKNDESLFSKITKLRFCIFK